MINEKIKNRITEGCKAIVEGGVDSFNDWDCGHINCNYCPFGGESHWCVDNDNDYYINIAKKYLEENKED